MRHPIPTWTPRQAPRSAAVHARPAPATAPESGPPGAARDATPSPLPIGGYRFEHQIGEGGSSLIYAAHHVDGDRRVAVKIPKEQSPSLLSGIKQEFRATRRLDHPHIVRMHHLLPTGDRFAAVMECLDGPTLMDHIRGSLPQGALPSLPRLKFVTSQLAAALAHVHASGWIHGDIKPHNVHFTADGLPRWIDFGLSTRVDRPTWMPRSTNLVGTFAYLPPESIRGEPLTPASDMYSFGRLLSKLLCGRLPTWDPDTGAEASAARIRAQLPTGTPRPLADVCTRLVHLSPHARPSAAEVCEILAGRHQSSLSALPPAGSAPQNVRAAARQALQRADGGLGTLLLVESAHPERIGLEGLITATRSEEPRLVLSGCCDSGERTPLPAFDEILDQLARWIEQVPAALREHWRRRSGDALSWANPQLAAALDIPCSSAGGGATASPEAACDALARLLTLIAAQRTVVLAIDRLDALDPLSDQLLARLVRQMESVPIVIIATTRHPAPPASSAVTTPACSPCILRVAARC